MTNRMNVFGRGHGLDGDQTTTGATCLSSLPQARQMRRGILRQGDVTTPCPACGESGKIMEGERRMKFHGIPVATDGALVLCGCPPGANRLVAPLGWVSNGQSAASSPVQARPASAAPPITQQKFSTQLVSAAPGSLEPGFFIVPKSMSFTSVLMALAEHDSTLPISRLQMLNPTFNDGFKAGEIFVIGDPDNGDACTREEAELMAAAQRARGSLSQLDRTEADFMMLHQAVIAGLLDGASQSMGVGKDMLAQGLAQVNNTLVNIEKLHQQQFALHGHLKSSEFFASRQRLFRQLDGELKAAFLNKQLNLGNYDRLKRSLGISSKSLVHHWSKAGGPGQIPGYATHLDEVARASKYLKYGGHLGTALGGASSYLKVQEVCRAGETEGCKQVRFTEAGSFSLGTGGAAVGATAGQYLASAICGFTGPFAPVCGIVIVGGGALIGGVGGSMAGESIGEIIFEYSTQ